jgi:type II restriction/modification system DNA methylase subunit YeeA
MKLTLISPTKSLNKAFQKQRITRQQIDHFKANLLKLFNSINVEESEEHLKNIVTNFLRDTYYKDLHYINTKERTDLVIHNGKTSSNSVGVIIEAKRPGNKLEMVSKKEANVKALHELILYYLRNRVDENNHEIKYLIATNIYEWFIFDSVWFEKYIYRNAKLIKDYEEWKVSGHDTKYFYENIAAKHLEAAEHDLSCTYFNLKDYEQVIADTRKQEDTQLVNLYKILSPEQLLKKPFANDSNSLNKEFYNELLHIVGLYENKDGGKYIIGRKPEKERNEGSLLESTIHNLRVRDRLKQVDNATQYGETEEEQLFSIALELCLTWLDRILFLKLLEGQLISYHRGDIQHSFLNVKRTSNYDELNELFFEVLALPVGKRSPSVKEKFGDLPYLNSSLFEETLLENSTFVISELKERHEIPVYFGTMLKGTNGKRKTGTKNTLHYLFEFLDAYDYSSEGKELIQEENKSIINASVLGLIFEKINGYKDGSYFTPGFITMYMCRETLRKAVVKKFQDSGIKAYQSIQTFDDLKDAIEYTDKEKRAKANDIINSMKVCDPTVGSGHFLVSALNELIAIKSDLRILNTRDGSRMKGYKIVVENDELIIINEETDELFEYSLNKNNKPIEELQTLQEALFHEKQTLIENCLFGVDINPKSVMICRLRLWIELLKNAYYTKESKYQHLETLPNIDINIKCGNSLISRYDVQADLSDIFRNDKNLLSQYRIAVAAYKNSTSKKAKGELQNFINGFKENIINKFYNNHPLNYKLSKYKGQLALVENKAAVGNLFGKLLEKDIETDVKKLKTLIEKTEQEIEDVKSNRLYEHAFEWRFEFPEVLDDGGRFLGFDVVLGNPPYIGFQELTLKDYYNPNYKTASGKYDIYVLFIELLSKIICENNSSSGFILPHKFMVADFGRETRKYLSGRQLVEKIVHFGQEMVFEDATTYTCILFFSKKNKHISFVKCDPKELSTVQSDSFEKINYSQLDDNGWALTDKDINTILEKIRNVGDKLEELFEGVFQGIVTGDNDAFYLYQCKEKGSDEIIGYSKVTNNEIVIEREICERLLSGKNMGKWQNNFDNTFIIYPYYLENKKTTLYAETKLRTKYPKAYKYLLSIKERLESRGSENMEYPAWYALWNARNIRILNAPKILTPDICLGTKMSFDEKGKYYHNDTSYSLVKKTSVKIPYEYFLGILNSKLMWFFLSQTGNVVRGGYFRFKTRYLEPVSIPISDKKGIELVIKEVDKILEKKQKSPTADTTDLEHQIDEQVYKIYGLTEEEIKIVEKKPNSN